MKSEIGKKQLSGCFLPFYLRKIYIFHSNIPYIGQIKFYEINKKCFYFCKKYCILKKMD